MTTAPCRVLVLAGTAEARVICAELAQLPRVQALASLAGATRDPVALGVPTRVGGFGGADAFADFLQSEAIDVVIDATHPFAEVMPARAAAVCGQLGLGHLRVLRPPWRPGPRDRWVPVARAEAVAAVVPRNARVLLATGPARLARFAGLAGRAVLCRRMEPTGASFPWAGGAWIVGRPPFTVEAETALLVRHGIDWLVTKNSGGVAGAAKLTAARRLGLSVAMIDRPRWVEEVRRVETAAAAIAWVQGLACQSV